MSMKTPFDECGTLSVTDGNVRPDRPSDPSTDPFLNSGKLFLVITPARRYVHFRTPGGERLPPAEVNRILKDLGVSVRVDDNWKPYVEDGDGRQDPEPGDGCPAEARTVRAGA
jgi:hypothetical protein